MNRYMYTRAELPSDFLATLEVAAQLSVPLKMVIKSLVACPSTAGDLKTLAEATKIAASRVSEKMLISGVEILSLVNNLSKQTSIGPDAQDDDLLSTEKLGYTPRGLWLEWLKRTSEEMNRLLRKSPTIKVIEADKIGWRNGDSAYFGGHMDGKHFWFSKTPESVKPLLENTYPDATIEIDGITLTVDVPDPDRQVSPARVFKSGSEGHEPFPEPVYLCKNSDDSVGLIGSAEPLFPVQFTGSSVVEIKGQEIRVFSWNRGLKNKAASKFFGRDLKGPIVLAIPNL